MLDQRMRRFAFRASLSLCLVGTATYACAQEDLRDSSVSISILESSIPAMPASYRANMPIVSDVVEANPSQASEPKDPIVLPPLTTPDLVLGDIGTGKMPDDHVTGRLPAQQALPYGPDRTYGMIPYQKTWTAPVFCHQPLYYEDTMLERHGHERFPLATPVVSGARFYAGLLTTPYLATLRRPLQEYPNTGHFRPGSAAPGVRERAPYDKTAMRMQLLATGGAFVIARP